MGYYVGDYYRGDYYRGDLFSFIGKALGGVAKVATGFVTGGPLGAISAGASLFSHPSPGGPSIGPAPFQSVLPPSGPSQYGLINISRPPAPMTDGSSMGMAIPTFGLPPGVMRGYHWNKTTYETRGGGTSRWPHELEVHAKHTVMVKNRRRNVGNARALRHALGRVGGFARLARRVMTFTHPRAGRGHFKFHRKKRAA